MKRAALTPLATLAAGITAPIAAPVIGAATAGAGSASVAFTAVAGGNNGGSAITSYVAVGSDGSTASSATSPIQVPNVTPGIPVVFTVAAVNVAGPGAWSAASNAITATAPATIPNPPLALALTPLASAISLAYTPGGTGGSAILDYLFVDNFGNRTLVTTNPQTIAVNPNTQISGYLLARNDQGYSLPSPQSLTVTTPPPTGTPTPTPTPTPTNIVLTQAQSPYTLQASDSGKTLAPATTAEFKINIPVGLGAAFACSVAPTGLYPVSFVEDATTPPAVSNSGFRISNVNKLANSVVMPGSTATVTASAADVLALGGTLGQWRAVVSPGAGLNDSNTGGAAVVSSFVKAKVRQGSGTGSRLKGIKVEYAHMYGQSGIETVPAYNVDVGFSLEYPLGTTPQLFNWNGVDQITLTPTVYVGLSDYLPCDIPLGAEIGIHGGQRTGITSNPCLSGKGSGVANTGEVFTQGTADGTNWKTNLSVIGSSMTSGAIANTQVTSPPMFRPSAIIGITDTGETIVLSGSTSRNESSNGDFQSVSSGFYGTGGRLLGDTYTTLNIGIAASQLSQITNATQGAYRRTLGQYCNTLFLEGMVNDANKPQSSVEALFGLWKAVPANAGKPLWVRTTSPDTSSPTDFWTTVSGQSARVLAQSQMIDSLNTKLVAKLVSGVNKVFDARPYTSVMLADGTMGWRVDPGARMVTDAAMNTGTNILTSATAAFTPADTGHYCAGMTAAGLTVRAVMTYIDATSVSLSTYIRGLPYNASTTATGMTVYLRSHEATGDGIHETKRQGEYEQANAAAMIAAAV